MQVEDLTLEKCVNMCTLFESSGKQLRTLGSSQPEPDVHVLRKMKLSSKIDQRPTSSKQALVEKQTGQKLTRIGHVTFAHINILKVNAQLMVNSVKAVAKEDISIKPRNAKWPRMMLMKLSKRKCIMMNVLKKIISLLEY